MLSEKELSKIAQVDIEIHKCENSLNSLVQLLENFKSETRVLSFEELSIFYEVQIRVKRLDDFCERKMEEILNLVIG